jgi:peptidoglycan/xylan/chitin deacetylase (PgdA/CDA1 family)
MTNVSLRVLTYHKVMDPDRMQHGDPSLISATPAAFDEQMRHVATRYRVVSAEQAADAFMGGPALPPRAVLITFDDATRDFGEYAWPILRRHGLPATVFVPSAFPGKTDLAFWWDRIHDAISGTCRTSIDLAPHGVVTIPAPSQRWRAIRGVQRLVKRLPHEEAMQLVNHVCRELGERTAGTPTLSWEELRALGRDGVSIGAHTHTHPALTRVSPAVAREEIRTSRIEITRAIGVFPRVFSYPFGDHDLAVANITREEGFDIAVTCLDGKNDCHVNPMRLRRINVTRRTTPRILAFRLTAAGISLDQWRHRRIAS